MTIATGRNLDLDEAKSTWLGNKAIYRTGVALADGAELIVLAPGVKDFGEDAAIDKLIRKHGYFGTPATLKAVENDPVLSANLSAAAHLIHVIIRRTLHYYVPSGGPRPGRNL